MRIALAAATLALSLAAPEASAWGDHYLLMPYVRSGLAGDVRAAVDAKAQVPCPSDDASEFAKLVAKLELAPGSRLPSLRDQLASRRSVKFPVAAARGAPCTPAEAPLFELVQKSVDEPDGEMDRMPESYDPGGDRRYMGGSTGDTGKGFRHMYFGGWKLSHPVTTFQVPVRALGQAPQRIVVIAEAARERIRAGDLVWGLRLLTWAMHYVQDLAQPFHSVQIITPKMIPWGELFQWPPTKGFGALVKESNRTVANYHWAIENYVEAQLRKERGSPYSACLTEAEKHQSARFEPGAGPEQITDAVIRASIGLAPRLGRAEFDFFGDSLMKKGVDLPNNLGSPDFAALVDSPALSQKRAEIDPVACVALANGISASRRLLEWAVAR